MSVLCSLTGNGVSKFFARNKWSFESGQHWAVKGPNGSGKSLLCGLLAGTIPAPHTLTLSFDETVEGHVALVSFSQQQAEARKNGWLQARYYTDGADSVKKFLAFDTIFDVNPFEVGAGTGKARRVFRETFTRVVRLLGITPLLPRAFISLSNGETRRVLLARALLTGPRLLILDDPCAGLDPARRDKVCAIFDALASRGVSLLVAVRHDDEIPSCVTHVMELKNGRIVQTGPRKTVPAAAPIRNDKPVPAVSPSTETSANDAAPLIELRNINIAFGKRKLFEHFNWTIRTGERWTLRGENGSGKTTLLSLISGDNPRAYANEVRVFGRQRVSGESLWDIRRRIGTVSPEQQSYFDPGISVLDAVRTGRLNEDGTIATSRPADTARARRLLRAFGISAAQEKKPFGVLSSGEQRLVLVARALASEPDLLLLDEPCMNLDETAVELFIRRVGAYLREHPSLTSVCVAHRCDDVPPEFTKTLTLG